MDHPNQEIINDHIESIAGLKADIKWLIRERNRFIDDTNNTKKHLAAVETKVIRNQKLLHGAFIGGGIGLAIFAALSPILMPMILDAIK